MATKLSEHFTFEEMTITQVRADNTPPDSVRATLLDTAGRLEFVRTALDNNPIKINSGYRSKFVNATVGGSPTSGHMKGYAVDFICPDFGDPQDIVGRLMLSDIKFDQLMEEATWVHISFDPRFRGQVFRQGARVLQKREEAKPMNAPKQSKINWTQAVALLATAAALFGVEMTNEEKLQVIAGIQVLQSVLTAVWRTWFTAPKEN